MAVPRFLRRLSLFFGAFIGLIVLVGGGVLGFAWFEHRTDVTLPTPTGAFAVGRAIQHWTDSATVDTLAPTPGTKRELLVWIWYPSAPGKTATVDDYVPAQFRLKPEAAPKGNIWTLLTRNVSNVRGHSVRDADVSPQQRSYPVVIMRAGASAGVGNYSTLAEDLASHGYVVVGFDAPYRTSLVVFPDGRVAQRMPQNNPERCVVPNRAEMETCINRVMTAWSDDIGFVLDRLGQLNASDASGRFTGHLDLSRVGVFGHSLGGAVAAQFCHDDPRCKAGLDIDGALHGSVIQEGLSQPFMFLLSDHSKESDPGSLQIKRDIKSVYDHLPPDRRVYATIIGAFHYTFSDDGALLKSSVVRGVMRMTGRLGIDSRRQLAVTTHCVHSFFDAYLKESGSRHLDIASPLYPEIVVPE